MPRSSDPDFPPVHVLICGDRNYEDDYIVTLMVVGIKFWHGLNVHIWHGAARGADSLAGDAAGNLAGIQVHPYPADWDKDGGAAGPIRNARMLDAMLGAAAIYENSIVYGVAFKDDFENGGGTLDMVRKMLKKDLPVYVISRPTLAELKGK